MKKPQDCTFCKIVSGELPSTKILETDNFLVIKNIKPRTKVHLLIITKTHYPNLLEVPSDVWNELQEIIKQLDEKYKPKGFRIASNIRDAALVQHMHFHFLAPVTKESEV